MYEDFVPERAGKVADTERRICTRYVLVVRTGKQLYQQHRKQKSLPAMQSFFYICEYLGVTPQEFFDEGNACPEALQEFIEEARKLDSRSMSYILGIMKELNSKR